MTIKTPEFQGTHLWDRLCWAKEKLEPYRTEYCVVWEDPETPDEPAKVTHPDPNWMACALQGGILPCLLYTSPSPRDRSISRMPSSA